MRSSSPCATPLPTGTLGYDDAIAMLPDQPRIHTFTGLGPMFGADMDREDILSLLRTQPVTATTQDLMIGLDHCLTVIAPNGRALYVQTRPLAVALRPR